MSTGRPSKLTPELLQRLSDAICAGNYLQTACGMAGIHYATFRRWMVKGQKARDGQFREFRETIRYAEAQAETKLVAAWQAHTPENWQAARDFLERRWPKRWARRDRKVDARPNKPTDQLTEGLDLTKLSDEQLDQLESLLSICSRASCDSR